MITPRQAFALAALLLTVTVARAGEAGTAIKADAIRATPFSDARTVGRLTTGDQVEILKREGGWFQVKSRRGSGWVRMLSVRRGAAQKPSAAAEARGVLGLASGRAGTGTVVATTGIRGLSEEDLKSAHYDEAQLKQLDALVVSAATAQKFATQGKLVARKVAYLPTPPAQQEAAP